MNLEEVFRKLTDLKNAIILLGQPSCFDYIQIATSIISIIISAVALVMAVRIPKKIACKQDKISLFDKRFAAYDAFLTYEAYALQIRDKKGVENYKRQFVIVFYNADNVEFYGKEALLKLQQISIPLKHMAFLYENISDSEVGSMISSICDFVVAMEKNINVEECKNKFINVVETFRTKNHEYITDILKMY